MKITKLKDVSVDAFKKVKKFQDGSIKVIKTNQEYIDNVGIGFINGTVITLAAGTGVGKSYTLQQIIKNIMDVELNPDAKDYVSLNISLEMKIFSLILRGINETLDKGKKEILLESFTEEEKVIVKNYAESLQDDRFDISQSPTTPMELYTACRDYLDLHKDKKAVFISIDHMVLLKGDNKQKTIEQATELINILKMDYENANFILLSQTNGENLSRVEEKNKRAEPQMKDIFYSSFLAQVSDYVIVITNPYKMGIVEYSRISVNRYPHLAPFFLEEKKGKTSLMTDGMIYYHVLKCREADSYYVDIYAQQLKVPEEYKQELKPINSFESLDFEDAFNSEGPHDEDSPF